MAVNTFWRKVASGLVAFIPAARALAADLPPVMTRWVGGHVVRVEPEMLVITTQTAVSHTLTLTPASRIWHGLWLQAIAIEPGDHIAAWVTPQPDGAQQVDELWVNWMALQGQLRLVRPAESETRLELQDDNKVWQVRVVAQTAVAVPTLHPGQHASIVGRVLKDGTLLATTVAVTEVAA